MRLAGNAKHCTLGYYDVSLIVYNIVIQKKIETNTTRMSFLKHLLLIKNTHEIKFN